MILDTARTNQGARRLYAARGWTRDGEFLPYEFTLQAFELWPVSHGAAGCFRIDRPSLNRNSRSPRNRHH